MTRRRLFTVLVGILALLCAHAEDFAYQESSYSISCHCAFIHKTAATATVKFGCFDNVFNATLDGSSVPILGTVYCINDTLQAKYIPSGPTVRPPMESVMYLSGYYRKPHDRDRAFQTSPSTYRNISGEGTLSADASTMECVHLTADMLCMFYYAKTVDFSQMPQGVAQEIPIIMPDQSSRTLQVIYDGVSEYQGHMAYSLTANFTYDGQLSAYPISIKIDAALGIPVEFVANIDVGEVIMAYNY